MTTAETELSEAEARIRQLLADATRKRQEVELAPKHLLAQGMTAGAAIFGAGAAFATAIAALVKLLG